jgi:hypothetical protein
MKKLLVLMVVLFGGAMFLKGNVSVTQDNQVHVRSWTFPIPAAVRNSPAMGLISLMIQGLGANQQAVLPARTGTGAPPLPIVNTANGSYDGNRPAAASANGADQFNAAAKALGSR